MAGLDKSQRPQMRSRSIGASRPNDPATSGTKALQPMADKPMAQSALGKMSIPQLQRMLKTEKNPETRQRIVDALRKATSIVKGEKKFIDKMTDKASKLSEGGLTQPTKNQTGLKKLPTAVRNKMGFFKSGGMAPSGNNDMRKGGMFK